MVDLPFWRRRWLLQRLVSALRQVHLRPPPYHSCQFLVPPLSAKVGGTQPILVSQILHS